jgi:hypothetical protein
MCSKFAAVSCQETHHIGFHFNGSIALASAIRVYPLPLNITSPEKTELIQKLNTLKQFNMLLGNF